MFGIGKGANRADEENPNGLEQTTGSKHKIDQATAEAEFIRFCEANEIEFDESEMNDSEQESFSDIKKRIVRACMEGRVEVEGTSLKYTVSQFSPQGFKGETVVIGRPIGNAFSSKDGYDDKKNIHKLHGFMSAMTGKEVKYFSKIDIIDWKFFNAVASCFLSL
jgi:hypothetical protein